jgi:ATP-binding protein involved in chromosome partitioning
LKALAHVEDPDLKKDLVTLGMIKDLAIDGLKVSFKVELTTPACPMKDFIYNACVNAVKYMVSQEAEVHIEMTSRVTSNRMDRSTLPGVKNIIAVASGKGGVGKSTISSNLALALAANGAKVGLLDADIYGPSLPTMFGINDQIPEMKEEGERKIMLPIERMGIKIMSVGLLVEPGQAIVWRGPMISSALRQLINDVDWGELDYLIIDLPPGTGDIQLTLCQNFPLTGVVLVTTPQQVALDDAQKAAAMFRIPAINIPIFGVVENMAYFTPPELPNNKYYIFGQGGGQKLADQFDIPLLASIPISITVSEGGDAGKPAMLSNNSLMKETMMQMAGEVARRVAMLNDMNK